jgi:hypothetical protein
MAMARNFSPKDSHIPVREGPALAGSSCSCGQRRDLSLFSEVGSIRMIDGFIESLDRDDYFG